MNIACSQKKYETSAFKYLIIAESAEKRNSSKTGNSIKIKPGNKIMSFRSEHGSIYPKNPIGRVYEYPTMHYSQTHSFTDSTDFD